MSEEQIEINHTTPKENKNIQSIEEIVEITDEDKYKLARDIFIEQKLADLKSSTQSKKFSISSPSYRGFIHPDSEVKPTEFLDGFKLNDTSIYSDLLDNIRAYKKDDRWKSKSIREINPYAITKTLGEYFGNYIADEGLEVRHHSYYMNRSSSDSEAFPLSELKGQGIAMCTEKAAAVQNLLTILDYDSELCLSHGCELVDGKKEMHAFNILSSDRGKFIYEPTNPIVVTDANMNIVNIFPAIYGITDNQYNDLMAGGNVSVEHSDFSLNEGKYIMQEVEIRKYGGLSKNTN